MLVDGLYKGSDSLRPHIRIDAVSQVGNPTASITEFLHHLSYRGLDGLVRSGEAARAARFFWNFLKNITTFVKNLISVENIGFFKLGHPKFRTRYFS